LISLVSAVNVETNKDDYDSGETVAIDVTQCTGTSILKIINSGFNVVDIKSGMNSWSASYNTLSDSSDGKYTITVDCDDGSANTNFCVDDPGCLDTQIQDDEEDETSPGSGGLFCTPQWSCSTWSFCNKDLQQTRDCTDLSGCELPRQEFRGCSQCDESWICSIWSQCSNGVNLRNCFDEHECGTSILKPGLQKSCQAASASGPQPRQISNQLPPPSFAQPQAQSSGLQKFWEEYKAILVLGTLSLVILVIIVLLLIHFLKPKHFAYNLHELKEWVRKESAMGTSKEDIRAILKQNTGWKDQEIDAAFESLRPVPMPKQKPIQPKQLQPKQLLPPEKSSLPEYTAAKEEPTVKIDNRPVFQVTMPSSQKQAQKPAVRKRVKFSEERTLFKKKMKPRIIIPEARTPPKRIVKRKHAARKHAAKRSMKAHKKTLPKKSAEKEPAASVKVTESKKSSKKNAGTTTTTTTTTVKKTTLGPKGKSAKKSSKPKEEVVKTVKTVVKKK